MKNVVNVINDISNVLSSDKEPGDPDDRIEKDSLTMLVYSGNADQLDNTTIESNQGGVTLPNIKDLFNGTELPCVDTKVCTIAAKY